jgi:hypothetical protein
LLDVQPALIPHAPIRKQNLRCSSTGPIAAYLIEAYSAKIRYSSLSSPYRMENGVFDGLWPLIGRSFSAATGDACFGLCGPTAVAALTSVVGPPALEATRHVLFRNETAGPETSDKPRPPARRKTEERRPNSLKPFRRRRRSTGCL